MCNRRAFLLLDHQLHRLLPLHPRSSSHHNITTSVPSASTFLHTVLYSRKGSINKHDHPFYLSALRVTDRTGTMPPPIYPRPNTPDSTHRIRRLPPLNSRLRAVLELEALVFRERILQRQQNSQLEQYSIRLQRVHDSLQEVQDLLEAERATLITEKGEFEHAVAKLEEAHDKLQDDEEKLHQDRMSMARIMCEFDKEVDAKKAADAEKGSAVTLNARDLAALQDFRQEIDKTRKWVMDQCSQPTGLQRASVGRAIELMLDLHEFVVKLELGIEFDKLSSLPIFEELIDIMLPLEPDSDPAEQLHPALPIRER